MAQESIGRDAVALGQHDEIAADHITSSDALAVAVTDHEGAWAGEVTEGFQRVLRPPLLNDRDGHDHEHEPQQHQGVGWLPEEEVRDPGGDQHEEHRLTNHLKNDREQVSLLLQRDLVRSFRLQAQQGFSGVKANEVLEIEDSTNGMRSGRRRRSRGFAQVAARLDVLGVMFGKSFRG